MLLGSMMAPLNYVSDARVIADCKLLGTGPGPAPAPKPAPAVPRGPIAPTGGTVLLAGMSRREAAADSKREAAQMQGGCPTQQLALDGDEANISAWQVRCPWQRSGCSHLFLTQANRANKKLKAD